MNKKSLTVVCNKRSDGQRAVFLNSVFYEKFFYFIFLFVKNTQNFVVVVKTVSIK